MYIFNIGDEVRAGKRIGRVIWESSDGVLVEFENELVEWIASCELEPCEPDYGPYASPFNKCDSRQGERF